MGLPDGVNYVFDAEKCQLAYAWTGGFLDMQPSWSGRGGQVVRVLGKRFYENKAFPLRIGDASREPERKFQGYELAGKIPTFDYTMDGIPVRERIEYSEKNHHLIRTFDVAANGKKIVLTDTNQRSEGTGDQVHLVQNIPVKESK